MDSYSRWLFYIIGDRGVVRLGISRLAFVYLGRSIFKGKLVVFQGIEDVLWMLDVDTAVRVM